MTAAVRIAGCAATIALAVFAATPQAFAARTTGAPSDTLEHVPLSPDSVAVLAAAARATLDAAAATTPTLSSDPDVADLQTRRLLLPVEGVRPSELRDGFLQRRGRRTHHGIDIMAPRHTPIHAVEDGVIARLDAHGGAGGITIYQFDPTGAFGYYYAHLERWADGLTEGDVVARGQIIGYVGSTGNAPERSPHLHFAIHRLGPDRRPWVGSPLNPFLVFLR